MYCTYCGAKIDGDEKFCPVCGNKLKNEKYSKIPIEDPVEEVEEKENSTYQSLSDKENQIKNEEKEENSNNKFDNLLKNFKIKKKTSVALDTNKETNEVLDENINAKDNEKSKEKPASDKKEIPSAYYGYNPTDERKSRYIRHKENGERFSNFLDKKLANKNVKQHGNLIDHTNEEINKTKKEKNIPYEYVEARVARILKSDNLNDLKHKKETLDPSNIPQAIRYFQKENSNSYVEKEFKENISQKSPEIPRENREIIESTKAVNENIEVKEEKIEENKKSFSFKPIYFLPIILLVAGIIIAYLFLNKKAKDVEIDLSNYINVTFTGEDGQASPSASLDKDRLLADFGSQIVYKKKDRKSDQYDTAAKQFVDELEKSTSFNFSKDNNLSNGEEITVVANISDQSLLDSYNVLFTSTIKPVIVDNLNLEESVDPFNYINVEYEGESPNINLKTSLTEDAPDYMSQIKINPSKTSELSSGEEYQISLEFDQDALKNDFGVTLSPIEKTFTVAEEEKENDEEKPTDNEAYITTVDDLDKDLLGTLKEHAGKLIKETFQERSFTKISNINYLGAITGKKSGDENLKNRVMLIYEIKTNENYEEKYKNEFTYYSFVEYKNVKSKKDEDGKFYSEGPLTTDNEIYHKFFVEDDYTYYEIPYYGFSFLDEVLDRVNNALSGLEISNSIAIDQNSYFTTSDSVAGEYQGNNTRLSLRTDGSLRYQIENRIHQGSYRENNGEVLMTIQGVNVDTPINAKYENGSINISEQGEMKSQSFNKIQR